VASWSEIEAEAPELAARARELLEARTHRTLATLRRDGSPRISGTEIKFAEGEVWFGSMGGSLKTRDLQRDPRFAIHSGSDDPPDWKADAKFAGRAEEIAEPARFEEIYGAGTASGDPAPHLFRADITELVVTAVGGDPPDHLVIEFWHPGRGVTRRERR
jgi:hypothetical protein